MSWKITSVSLSSPSVERRIKGVRYINMDIRKFDEHTDVLQQEYDYVVNLGGYVDHRLIKESGLMVIDSHYKGILKLIDILPRKKIKRFVQIGSSDEYGNTVSPQVEEIRENPISPYSFAKTATTHFLQMLHKTENYPVVILRPFLVYGPNQGTERFIPQVINGCLENKEFPASLGMQLRDFCYIDDVVEAIFVSLTEKNAIGQVINIGSGEPTTVRSIVEKIVANIGTGSPNYGEIPYRTGENMSLFADVNKAYSVLGWKPNVSFDEGVIRTIGWFTQKKI